MSEDLIAEGIYIKQGKGQLGSGATAKEYTLETYWFPYRANDSYVELFPVTDNLQSILAIKEKIPIDIFKKEYSLKEDSRDTYLTLRKRIPR